MKETRSRKIITVLLGVLIGLFGLFCLILPNQASGVLSVVFGLAILVTAILAVVEALSLRRLTRYWSIVFVEGIVDIVLGLILILVPDAIEFIVKVMGAWAVTFGVFRLVRGVLRDGSEIRILITGLAASALGILMFVFPEVVQQAVTYVIGSILVIGSVIVVWANIVSLRASGKGGGQADPSPASPAGEPNGAQADDDQTGADSSEAGE